MADADKPSLTPHRDQVEKMLAQIDAQHGTPPRWQDQLARRLVGVIHLMLADERDAGRDLADISRCLPFLTYNAASALLGSVGMPDDLMPSLLKAASHRDVLVSTIVVATEAMPKGTGGRA